MQATAKYTLKENEEEARERLRAFWNRSSLGRPALHVTVARPCEKRPWPHPDLGAKDLDLRPDYWALCAGNALPSRHYLAESFPNFIQCYASHLALVGVLAGADYEYEGTTAWTKPIPRLWERDLPRFDPGHRVVKGLEACLRSMAEVVGRQGYLNPPALLDGMTVLSVLRTPEQLCYDVLEEPEQVARWRDALTELGIACHAHFYRLVCELGYGETNSWLPVMAEGRFEAVQCDFSVMLSPEMYAEFVMPLLRRMTAYMDFSIYHLDGTCQLRFLDQLARLPRLNGIQWNPEPRAGSVLNWLPAFRDIRKRGLALFMGCGVDEAVRVTRELGPDGLMFALPEFKTLAEAEAAIVAIQRAC